jgi:hypothetical protein
MPAVDGAMASLSAEAAGFALNPERADAQTPNAGVNPHVRPENAATPLQR